MKSEKRRLWAIGKGLWENGGWVNAGIILYMKEITLSITLKIIILFVCPIFLSTCLLKAPTFDEVKWRNEVSHQDSAMLYAPHFKDGKFYNPWMPMDRSGLGRVLKWKLTQKDEYTDEEKSFMPGFMADLKGRIEKMPCEDFIAWIGHATFLIRINGEYWLTDPIFSERALLPKRKTPPAISLDEMKELDGRLNIIISHNHYDHYDKPSISGLPGDVRIYVPLGLKESVEGLNKQYVTEMDWWQTIDLGNGSKLVCLPAQHWSRRISQGIDTTLWASFLLITPNATVFYGGDSGYFIGYKEIGKLYPGIDYALLPVGAYHPRWFMHYAHMDIQEVLQAFGDLNAKYFIPSQWGTFQLGNEPIGYPIIDLKRTMIAQGFDASRAIIINLGEIIPVKPRASKDSPMK
jgi:L-ascorbate metabolism protein UlaG (beta-lactamase superfamily)